MVSRFSRVSRVSRLSRVSRVCRASNDQQASRAGMNYHHLSELHNGNHRCDRVSDGF
jgi:hypothetical protein